MQMRRIYVKVLVSALIISVICYLLGRCLYGADTDTISIITILVWGILIGFSILSWCIWYASEYKRVNKVAMNHNIDPLGGGSVVAMLAYLICSIFSIMAGALTK